MSRRTIRVVRAEGPQSQAAQVERNSKRGSNPRQIELGAQHERAQNRGEEHQALDRGAGIQVPQPRDDRQTRGAPRADRSMLRELPGAVDDFTVDRLRLELGAALRAEERLGRHRTLAAWTGLHGSSVLALPTVPAPEKSSVSITIRIQDGIARITLDRPPLNVLDVEMLRRLNGGLRECDEASVRVVVITSALPHAFSAGVEVRDHRAGRRDAMRAETPRAPPHPFSPGVEGRDHRAGRLDAMLSEVRENARLLLTLQPVTIAAVRGSTLGGGGEIALLCALVLAADDTVFGFPEIKLGAFPPVAAACLPEICGAPRAMRLLLGQSITADAAQHAGLVTAVVPAGQLAETVDRIATELAARSGVARCALPPATRAPRA